MDAALQRRIQRYGWDKAANYYAQFWQEQLESAQTRLLECTNLQPGESVLDIACGSGFLTFRFAEMVGQQGSVLGTDISDSMIDISKRIAEERKIKNVHFERMDAEDLAVSDSSFDVAICSLGLMYMPDAHKALNEMYRVLKPGGRIAALVWGERIHCGWAEIFPIVDSRVASDVCPLFFQIGTKNTLERKLEETGFSNLSSERLNTILHYTSPETACGAAFAGGPVALAYSRFSDEIKAAAHAEYLESIDIFRDESGYKIPGEFVIANGSKTPVF